jgi:tetratricopeptide (TPR) repeat protein
LLAATLLSSCSTKKNTVVSRAYHNITARYNGYYYSTLNIQDGIYKVEKNNKDNFDKLLPVYIYPAQEKVKATFPEFDKAIKKSSLCIQRHAIKDKAGEVIPSSGKWIDNNWINIGIAHFYKRELFSGLESFEYVARTFKGSKDRYSAMIWMIKANNEIGSVSSSETVLSLLNNEKNLPQKVKNELPAAEADYYMRRGMYNEASTKLMAAVRNKNIFTGVPKTKRARYCFIIGQLFEAQHDNKRAIQFYQRCIKMKPNYEMVFYSKIKIARLLDVKRTSSEKTKRDLLRMTRETKNSDYFDVIYYTLGEIEEKEKNTDNALRYYKRSVQTSSVNPTQKALSYLKLGEINFDRTQYQPAGYYYDSAVVTLPKDHKDYNNIVARKKTLQTLIGYIQTIRSEDSLQKFARMDSITRNKAIDKVIANMEKQEELERKRKEAAQNTNNGSGGINTGAQQQDPGTAASFYFYNPNTVALGVADFTKRWGNRKYEENWRRSNKALTMDNNNPEKEKKDSVATVKDPAKLRRLMIKNLPLSDSAIAKSTDKIVDSYYLMGSLYKEDLHNNKKATSTFDELNNRFPKNKYQPNTYYMIYRMSEMDKNIPQAETFKSKLLTEYPESEFATLLRNPNAAADLNAKKSEVESFYIGVYQAYQAGEYSQALSLSSEGVSKFGKNEYLPKFEFIKAMSYGKLRGVDSLEQSLKIFTATYPKSELTPLANDVLLSIKRQKNPDMFKPAEPGKLNADTFSVNHEAEHFVIAVVPDDPKIANTFKTNVDAFNQKYFSAKAINITSNLFGQGKQLVIMRPFVNAQEASTYAETLNNDKDVYKGEVKREMVELYPILGTNLPFLYKKKNIESYKLFYQDNYKKFISGKQ